MLAKRGMPTGSVAAAQAWRETNAKPRAKRGHRGEGAPSVKFTETKSPGPTIAATANCEISQSELPPAPPATRDATQDDSGEEEKNDPRQSLRRARKAELVGYNELVKCQRGGGSVEDFRKANSVYISARNNRIRAEKDFRDWQRDQSILLYFDEARDIASRPHIAARQMIEVMPKTLAPRIHNQPQKSVERTLAEWCDRLTDVIRSGI